MADILEGSTGHSHHAPLSHAQTVAIGRHLQDQIRLLQNQLSTFHGDLKETNDVVADLRKNAGGANSALLSLQDGLASANAAAEANRNELLRTGANVQRLQGGLEKTNDNVAKLRDAQEVANTNLRKFAQDLSQTDALSRKLQEALERKVEQDLGKLRDELSRNNLNIKNLRADQDALKAALHDDREAARQTDARVKENFDKLAEADTLLKILEQRVADNTTGLKTTRLNLEDLNTATLRLHEDHENTKNHVNELQNATKKVHNHVKQVHTKLDATSQGLGSAQEKLNQQIENAENLRQNLQQTQHKVQNLREGHDRANTLISTLHRDLAEVGATTQAVKAGLKEQSSLLLPNIEKDSPEARMATARHGSLLASNAAALLSSSATSPKKTPRSPGTNTARTSPSKEMAWT